MKKKELTSKQLIEAAFSLFAKHGIENTSLAMIASEVGISKPSIYYHFSSKDELVQRTFDYSFKGHRFNQYFQLELLDKGNFGEMLYEGGLKMLPKEDEEHFTFLKVLNEFMIIAGRDELFRESLIKKQQEFLEGFQSVLTRGSELGVVLPINIQIHAQILALVIDNISRCIMMNFSIDYKEVWKETVNSVLEKEIRMN